MPRFVRQTSKVAYKVGNFHFLVRFDVAVMEIGVEHDYSECQEEDRFRTAEYVLMLRITHTVSSGKRLWKI